MSFRYTVSKIKLRTKKVTRRKGWKNLKAGECLKAVDRVMGLSKGMHPKILAYIRVISTEWVRLNSTTKEDVIKEGLTTLSPEQFNEFFSVEMGVELDELVNRIEFEYLEPGCQDTPLCETCNIVCGFQHDCITCECPLNIQEE